ncbi:hypothetical protein J4439_07490 [Candidatus Woesearchaeota archaeon]|nr:hypothetical protein [Candidatus Woesearchaeota archaeon]
MGLFSKEQENSEKLYEQGGQQEQPAQTAVSLQEFLDQLGSLGRRVKIAEERVVNLSKRIQLSDHNLIESSQKLHGDLRAHAEEMQEVREKLHELEEKVTLIIREFRNVPRKEDLQVLEKYVTLWNPMEFLTRKEAEKLIGEAVEERIRQGKKHNV